MIWKGWRKARTATADQPDPVVSLPDVAGYAAEDAPLPPASAPGRAFERPEFLDSLWREDAVSAGELPVFMANASDDVSEGADAELSRRRLALRDALGASQPVTSREGFAGRHDAMRMLIEAIEEQRLHVVIYGERGIGKTSLTHVFAETARQARYLVIYASCSSESRFAELFRSVTRRIPRIYHSSVLPNSAEAEKGDAFDVMLPENFGPRDLADVLAGVVGTRVLLVLDEYDRVLDADFRRDVAELIKNLSDRAARVQLVMTGVAQNLDELIGFAPSIRRNIVGLPMRPLNREEVIDVLRLGEQAAEISYAREAADLIATMASGSPYLVRLMGHQSGMVALDAGRLTVTAADCTTAIEKVLANWNASLPRRVQLSLARDEARASWPALVAAARAGSSADGWFTLEEIAVELKIPLDQAPAIARQLAPFTEPQGLLAIRQSNGDVQYRFAYPGVSSLLLMSAAMVQLQGQ